MYFAIAHKNSTDQFVSVGGETLNKNFTEMEAHPPYQAMEDSSGKSWIVRALDPMESTPVVTMDDGNTYTANTYDFEPVNGVIPPSVEIEP